MKVTISKTEKQLYKKVHYYKCQYASGKGLKVYWENNAQYNKQILHTKVW